MEYLVAFCLIVSVLSVMVVLFIIGDRYPKTVSIIFILILTLMCGKMIENGLKKQSTENKCTEINEVIK